MDRFLVQLVRSPHCLLSRYESFIKLVAVIHEAVFLVDKIRGTVRLTHRAPVEE